MKLIFLSVFFLSFISGIKAQTQDTSICHKLIIDKILYEKLKNYIEIPESLNEIEGIELPLNRILKVSKSDLADCISFWIKSTDQTKVIDSYEFVWDGRIKEGIATLYTEVLTKKAPSHPSYRIYRTMKRYFFKPLISESLLEIRIHFYSPVPQFVITVL